jgi:PAS domain S-box-containing protein
MGRRRGGATDLVSAAPGLRVFPQIGASAPSDDPPGDPGARAAASPQAEPSTATLLVVDDRAENLLALESVLKASGHSLVLARSGAEALKYLLQHDCALILMDVRMPQLDGIETARLIRANPRTRAIPIVFMTAATDGDRFVSRGYDAGAVDYLLKPVDPDILRAKVAAFVELHRAREEVARQAALLRHQEDLERRRALAELELRTLRRERAAHERYRRLVDGITHAIVWTIDPVTLACTFASPSAGAILGHGVERWTADPKLWWRILPAEDRERLAAGIGAAAAGGSAASVAHGFTRADGRVARFETEVRLVPARDEGRTEVRAFSVDVTDARRAEASLEFLDRAGSALGASLELQQTVDVAARVAVPFLGDWCVVFVQPPDGADPVVGAAHPDPAREEVARTLAADQALPAPPQDGRAAPTADARAGLGPEAAAAAEALAAAGPIAAVSVALVAGGRLLGALRLFSGPGRTFGPAEARLAEELGRRASQAIDRALLYREAREAIALREEFISIASHELRTPLTPLLLQTRALQRIVGVLPAGPDRDGVLERLASCTRQVDRMTRLVANLLDVTRLHTRGMELEPEPFDLRDLVLEVGSRFREELARAERALELAAEEPLPGRWDRLRIDQVITNLVSNAVRYGRPGPVRLSLRREGARALVVVEDEGPGISPEEAPRIFERYFRGTAARAAGGLGLGLYITRRIVEAHGGRVDVKSAPGKGTTFTVELPLEPAPAPG